MEMVFSWLIDFETSRGAVGYNARINSRDKVEAGCDVCNVARIGDETAGNVVDA